MLAMKKIGLTILMCLLCLNPAFAVPGNTPAPDTFPVLKIFKRAADGQIGMSSGIIAHYKGLPVVVMSQHGTLNGSDIGSRFFIANERNTTLARFNDDFNDGFLSDYTEINADGGLWRASSYTTDNLHDQVASDIAFYEYRDPIPNNVTRVDIPETLNLNAYTQITLYGSGPQGNRAPGIYQYPIDANNVEVVEGWGDVIIHRDVITVSGDSGGPMIGRTSQGSYELIGTVAGGTNKKSYFSIMSEETMSWRPWDCEI